MAKLSRESRLRERRMLKEAKKEARRNAPPLPPEAPVVIQPAQEL
ncbi:MAG TPA: hypothetical protein VG325_19825 [Solirubrobacteraceae bacterium]|nr:hypothetical protein [Solirubrobacteraceae bacterium]